MEIKEIFFEFSASTAGRLDSVLCEANEHFTRSNVAAAIKSGLVLLNDKTENKPSKAVKIGDKITLLKPLKQEKEKSEIKKSELFEKIQILYEDDDIMVISKPAGLVVHDAPSLNEATLVDFLKAGGKELSRLNGEFRAGIVHRLDRLTSGAMVVAKSDFASVDLSAQLKDKSAGRIYLALVDLPLKENCVINKALARCESNRLKKAVYPLSHAGAKSAKSAFCNIFLDDILENSENSGQFLENSELEFSENYAEFSKNCSEFSENKLEFSENKNINKNAAKGVNLIACKLFTGRTHQIRAHLASINRHILGDILYGFKGSCAILTRIFLHAYILELKHPRTGQKMIFKAPISDDFVKLLSIKREILDEKLDEKYLFSCFAGCDEWVFYS